MKDVIVFVSVLGILFVFMHEFDACRRGEWRMLKFLRFLPDEGQYYAFFAIHAPLTLFALYYLRSVLEGRNFTLWVAVNSFLIFHLFLHLVALRWKSNVFKNAVSFACIGGGALAGAVNLCLVGH